MTAPASPSPSSTNSCISDSDTSNDSGIDSMAGGSLPPDYMDLDEFLQVTRVKYVNKQSTSGSITNSFSENEEDIDPGPGPPILQSYRRDTNSANEEYLDSKNDKNKTATTNAIQPKGQNSRKTQEEEYTYKYNPLPVKKKAKRKFVSDTEKDEQYWKRRIRNNEAARRSRDMRRQREIEISSKWRDLEKENTRLKKELQKLKERANELERQLMDKENQQ